MPLRAVEQLALDETVVEDTQLEQALEERQRRRVAASELRREFAEADEQAKSAIAKLELPAGTAVRVGRFRITRTDVPPRSISFETEAKSRVSIALIDGDE